MEKSDWKVIHIESKMYRLLGIKRVESKRAIIYARVSSEKKKHLMSQAKSLMSYARELMQPRN